MTVMDHSWGGYWDYIGSRLGRVDPWMEIPLIFLKKPAHGLSEVAV